MILLGALLGLALACDNPPYSTSGSTQGYSSHYVYLTAGQQFTAAAAVAQGTPLMLIGVDYPTVSSYQHIVSTVDSDNVLRITFTPWTSGCHYINLFSSDSYSYSLSVVSGFGYEISCATQDNAFSDKTQIAVSVGYFEIKNFNYSAKAGKQLEVGISFLTDSYASVYISRTSFSSMPYERYEWYFSTWSTTSMVIKPTLDACYTIAVYASSYASFVLSFNQTDFEDGSYSSPGSCSSLYPSYASSEYSDIVSFQDIYNYGTNRYYFNAIAGKELAIMLTGDYSDLYIAKASNHLLVDSTFYDQFSIGSYFDAIEIVPVRSECYVIAVQSYDSSVPYGLTIDNSLSDYSSYCSSNFSLSPEYSGPVTGIDSTINQREYSYFYYSVGPWRTVNVTVRTFAGDADLYVSEASVSAYPTLTSNQKFSVSAASSDSILFDSSSSPLCLSIGVYGYSPNTEYRLIVSYTVIQTSSDSGNSPSGGGGKVATTVLSIVIPMISSAFITWRVIKYWEKRKRQQQVANIVKSTDVGVIEEEKTRVSSVPEAVRAAEPVETAVETAAVAREEGEAEEVPPDYGGDEEAPPAYS